MARSAAMKKMLDDLAALEAMGKILDEALKKDRQKQIDKIKTREESPMVQISTTTAKRLKEFLISGHTHGGDLDYSEIEDVQEEYGYPHMMQGRCPDHEGDRRRDPECPACKLLAAVEDALNGNSGTDEDDFDKILNGKW